MAKEAKQVPLLQITAKRPGFRRAGIAHPDTPTNHRLDKFSKKQVEELKAEKMLVVTETTGPDPEATAEEGETK